MSLGIGALRLVEPGSTEQEGGNHGNPASGHHPNQLTPCCLKRRGQQHRVKWDLRLEQPQAPETMSKQREANTYPVCQQAARELLGQKQLTANGLQGGATEVEILSQSAGMMSNWWNQRGKAELSQMI